MTWEAWLVIAVTAATIVALARELAAIEVTMASAVTVLLLAGVLSPEQALAGFASSSVLTIGALFVVAAGIDRTGLLHLLADRLFGRRPAGRAPLLRMSLLAASASTFLNNTTIVAMFAPTILGWCRRNRIAPSRMLMPLSYATILGGMSTLIGTSTNLVVDGLMREAGLAGMGMFELAPVALPAALLGLGIIALLAPRLVPDRRDPGRALEEEGREFMVEMLVDQDSPLAGRTLSDAGLRNLPGLYVVALERDGRFTPAVRPSDVLRAGDRLVFAGLAATVIDLQRFAGLRPAPETHYDPGRPGLHGHLFEAVVSPRCPVVDQSIREAGFRSRYNAVVLAVHRGGQRLAAKLGDVRLRAGDTLILEASEDFDRQWGNSGDFALVARVDADMPTEPRKALVALGILAALIAIVSVGVAPMVTAALAAAVAMVLSGVLSARQARRAISLQVLIVIACAMALGKALDVSGAAEVLGGALSAAGWQGGLGLLAATFVSAALLNAVVGNVAAAAITFPVAMSAAAHLGMEPRAVALTIALGAGSSFLSPTVYPANLIVYGPGGYRYLDFARLGAPVLLSILVVTLLLGPLVW